MSDGILPTRFTLVVEREVVGDVLVNLTQCQSPVGRSVDGHGNESGVRVRGSDQLHQVFLRGQREPAQFPSRAPGCCWTQVRPLHAVVLRDKGGARVTRRTRGSQVRRGVDPRAVEPEVRVWRGSGVVAQVVGGRSGALRTRQRGRRVVAVAVHAELRGLLSEAGELRATAWRRLALGLERRHCQVSSHPSVSTLNALAVVVLPFDSNSVVATLSGPRKSLVQSSVGM